MLTANYMPEYGRASGGQIRFISKSGSNRYSGNASFFMSDEALQANTWARNRSTERDGELRPGAVRPEAVRLLVRRPDPGRACSRTSCSSSARRNGSTSSRCRRTPRRCRRWRCAAATSASCSGANPFFSSPQVIRDPRPASRSPATSSRRNRLSPNGMGIMNLYPVPTAGLPAGHHQRHRQQRQPAGSAEGQHPASTTG